jgi:hypothetical protein
LVGRARDCPVYQPHDPVKGGDDGGDLDRDEPGIVRKVVWAHQALVENRVSGTLGRDADEVE